MEQWNKKPTKVKIVRGPYKGKEGVIKDEDLNINSKGKINPLFYVELDKGDKLVICQFSELKVVG